MKICGANKNKPQNYVDAIKDFSDLIMMEGGPKNEFEELYLQYKNSEKVYRHFKRKVERYSMDKRGTLYNEWRCMEMDDEMFALENKRKRK